MLVCILNNCAYTGCILLHNKLNDMCMMILITHHRKLGFECHRLTNKYQELSYSTLKKGQDYTFLIYFLLD